MSVKFSCIPSNKRLDAKDAFSSLEAESCECSAIRETFLPTVTMSFLLAAVASVESSALAGCTSKDIQLVAR
jgi:hypothetical protein